jgi:hypothetical protein
MNRSVPVPHITDEEHQVLNDPRATAGIVIVLLAVGGLAEAQPAGRVYVGATAGPYRVDADHVTGTLPSAGGLLGVRVGRRVSLEVGVARPVGTLRHEHTGISSSFAPLGSSFEEIERQGVLTRFTNERVVQAVVSGGVVLHPSDPTLRVQPRLFVGTTTHFAREVTRLEHLRLPAGVTIEDVTRRHPPQPPRSRGLGSLTFGAGVAIAITRQLSVVPDIRYDYGSIGDEINNMLRTDVRFMWRF